MIVPVMAISNLVLTQQIYSEETNGAHAHYREPVPLNNNILELTSEFRDLGLVTDCNLFWSTHIDKISNKANKILGLIKRTCKGFQDVSTLRTLYLVQVRSQLEYFSVLWSPHTSRKISKLEGIQRRATKFISKTNDDYEQREKKVNLLSLEQI